MTDNPGRGRELRPMHAIFCLEDDELSDPDISASA
jgi:hypothetical protein